MVLQEIDADLINRRALEKFLQKRFGEEPYNFVVRITPPFPGTAGLLAQYREEDNHWVLDVPEYIPDV
jgi:hypothetical protein